MPHDFHQYTREHLAEVIHRLRENPGEFNRIKSSLTGNFARTLLRDMDGGWERRVSARKLNPEYMRQVCLLTLNRFDSEIYNSILNAIAADSASQLALDTMIGKYKAYWPSDEINTFESFQFEIGKNNDGVYWVYTTTRDANHEYNHLGYAFLIRKRVHVVAASKFGLRTMIFHYEQVPARHPPRGIIMNILDSDDDARTGEHIYAVHFLAIHHGDRRYHGNISDSDIARILHHDRNRTGVIRL